MRFYAASGVGAIRAGSSEGLERPSQSSGGGLSKKENAIARKVASR
jgi:hypothetical protein